VKQIKAAGGIIIAKTNVPQTMMSFECSNPLWGVTTNPWSNGHTCGGSSGGEAAALACNGSVIGIGSDIGRFSFISHLKYHHAKTLRQAVVFVFPLTSVEFTLLSQRLEGSVRLVLGVRVNGF
jgi:Amidase